MRREAAMANNGSINDIFGRTLQKTHEWLHELMDDLGWEDTHRAYLALRCTLHALRDRLTVEEAAKLAAQLPMLVRGFYFEGWTPSGKPLRMRHKDDFIDHIRREIRIDIGADLEEVARAVFRLLARRIGNGEISDVIGVMPRELRELWPAEASRRYAHA
jgi:uncharacterized protein (DUF2267 family)